MSESPSREELKVDAGQSPLAQAKKQLGDGLYGKALQLFSQAGGVEGAWGETVCLYNLNQRPAAYQACGRVLQLDPAHEKARQLLQRLESEGFDKKSELDDSAPVETEFLEQVKVGLSQVRTQTWIKIGGLTIAVILLSWLGCKAFSWFGRALDDPMKELVGIESRHTPGAPAVGAPNWNRPDSSRPAPPKSSVVEKENGATP